MTKRYEGLNGIRVLAMIGILVMHVLENLPFKQQLEYVHVLFGKMGYLTSLFMMVSAFSVCCGYYDKILTGGFKSIEEFYAKRFKKIFPFFAFLTIIDIIISPSLASMIEGFANFTLIFGLIPHENITVIGVGWTLGVIFLFYILFPFFVFIMKDKRKYFITLICSLLYSFIFNDYFGLQKVDFLFCAVYFVAGCGIYLYRNEITKIFKRIPTLILIIVVTIINTCIESIDIYLRLPLFALILIYGLVVSDRKSILNTNIMKWLSEVSLEIYLSHMFIYRILEKVGILQVSLNSYVLYFIICILVILGTIVLGKGFQLIYEKICILYKHILKGV